MEVDSSPERDERLRIFKKESNFTLLFDPNEEIGMVQCEKAYDMCVGQDKCFKNVLISHQPANIVLIMCYILVPKLLFNCPFTTFLAGPNKK